MTEEQNIVLDKEYIENIMELVNNDLRNVNSELFYLDVPITFKHLVTGEQATITNIPIIYRNNNYYLVTDVYNIAEHRKICPEITHVNISRNIQWVRCTNGIELCTYHFCAGNNLNNTPPEKHFGNQELIKLTLAMILPNQNPSNAYFNAENYLGIINSEQSLRCSQCSKVISPDSSIIELLTRRCGAHVREQDVESIIPDCYYVKEKNSSSYRRYDTRLTTADIGAYRIITPEEIKEELKDYKLNIDSIFVGCGSAGSNIGSQLARTDLIHNGILIDFDNVESKNLRNQAFLSNSCGYNKSEQLAGIMTKSTVNYCTSSPYRYRPRRIQDTNLEMYIAKYLFNCVDSLTARKYAVLNAKTRYIIDTRYHGLDCSIFFVDTEDKDQMKYYLDGLDQAIQTYVKDVHVDTNLLTPNMCSRWGELRRIRSLRDKCYSNLKKYTDKFYNSIPLEDKERLLHIIDKERQTCNNPNIIDIYSVSASIIVGLLRELENNNNKLFTHLELTTQNAIPQTMIVRK